MEDTDKLFCLIKFGKKEYMEKLFKNGELYFNISSKYNDLQTIDKERGDENEGAEWIINEQIKSIKIEHPSLGKMILRPVSEELSKLVQYNYYYLSYSLLAISSRTFSETDEFQIDKRILNMSETDMAVIITDPYKFLNSVSETIKNEKLAYERNLVKYKPLNIHGKVEMNPFVKKEEHQYQMEYRIIIQNTDDKAKKIQVGSIADYSYIVSAESMIDATWNARRQ